MRILRFNDRLVEEVGHVVGDKVVFLRYVKQEDMPKCKCGRPIDKEIAIVEGCLNWQESIVGVDTISKKTYDNGSKII